MACGIAFAVPIVGYEAWYKSAHGQFTMTESTGVFLYSRVMTFADCSRMTLPVDLLPLCTSVPPAQRPIAQAYIWDTASPLNRFPAPKFSPTVNKLAEKFAIKAIEAQPLDYARTVWDDTVRSFDWSRQVFPNGADLRRIPVRLPLAGHPRIALPRLLVARGLLRARQRRARSW